MSKCWSRLEAASASELNSSRNVKWFYRKECLSLACQGHFLLVFLVPCFNDCIALSLPVSCPRYVQMAEGLVLVLSACCCYLGGSETLYGLWRCTCTALFNGRSSAGICTSPLWLLCQHWWLLPVDYSSVATLMRDAILVSEWKFMVAQDISTFV